MEIKFINFNESRDSRWYKGYEIKRNPEKSPGEFGLWYIPQLYYRAFGNKIEKGFETVSIIQSKQAIDEWFDFNLKVSQYMNESYRKDKYENDKVIIVDIQPSYRIHMNMDMSDFTNWLNHHEYMDILYLYNGPDFGYEGEDEIKDWLTDYGLDLYKNRNIEFFEKNYAFFRDMMDNGASDEEIVKLGKYMIKNDIFSSNDIKVKIPGVSSKWFREGYGIYIPDVQDVIKNFLNKGDKPLLIGGGQYECFKEILLLLQMNDIKWDEESQFIW